MCMKFEQMEEIAEKAFRGENLSAYFTGECEADNLEECQALYSSVGKKWNPLECDEEVQQLIHKVINKEEINRADLSQLSLSTKRNFVLLLLEGLFDKDIVVQTKVLKILEVFGKEFKLLVPFLVKRLNHPEKEKRIKTIQLLRKMKTEARDAVLELTKLLKDSDSQIQLEAALALDRIEPELQLFF